jgi:ppGpp synthetase/RelA/SpoT-type nucleotidyltranferase
VARLEGPELNIRCREVADFTDKASTDNNLMKVLDEATARVSIYAFKTRFKKPGNILKKVERKRREGASLISKADTDLQREKLRPTPDPARIAAMESQTKEGEKLKNYNPDHVTDAWGCRFVTLYQSEIPVTISALLETLSAFNETCPSAPVRLREFVIYTNRPSHDPLSIVSATQLALERSKFADSTSVIRPPENRKSAYSSVHLVFDRDVEIEHPGKPRGVELATFEIQVRDIFEEGWGEVQHHLLYSEKDDPVPPEMDSETSVTEQWRLHLNALKTFVDGCSQHASIIRMHHDATKRGPTPTNVTQSITERERDRTAVIHTLKRLNAPEAAREAILKAYALVDAADQRTGAQDRPALLCEAADLFHQGLEQLDDRSRLEKVRSDTVLSVEYFVGMEEAGCLASAAAARGATHSETKQGEPRKPLLERARGIYRELARRHRHDPVVHFRYGAVLESLAESEAELEEALASIERGIKILDSDPLGFPDHWLRISSHVKKGYLLWMQAQKQTDGEERIRLITEAGTASLDALDAWHAQSDVGRQSEVNRLNAHKAASNVLFFGGKLMLEGKPSPLITADVIKKHMTLISRLNIDVYSDYFKTRDNLIFAHRALGEKEAARTLALTNFRELRRLAEQRAGVPLDIAQVHRHLHGSEANCFETARDVLFGKAGLDEEPRLN